MNIINKYINYIQGIKELEELVCKKDVKKEGNNKWELSEDRSINKDNLKRVLKEKSTLFRVRDFNIKEIQRITKGIGVDWHGCIHVTFKLTYTGRLTIPIIYNVCKDKVTYEDLAEAIEEIVCKEMFEYIINNEKTGLYKD